MVRLTALMCAVSLMTGTLVAGSAMAASLTPDFGAASVRESQLRDGDFNGDGLLDDLYLVAEDSGRVAVRVRLSPDRDIRLTSVDAPANAPLNLQVVAAGQFQGDCGTYADDCTGAIVTASDSVVVTLDSGVNVLIHWQGDRFEQDFVRSDEAMMARVLAGLVAFNP